MGKKINPKIFRLKSITGWDSRWFADRNYQNWLRQDVLIRKFLRKKLLESSVSRIEIERSAKDVRVTIFSARPGTIIGKAGAGIDDLRKSISRQFVKNKAIKVNVNIKEIGKPNLDAALVAQSIKFDIEKRIAFRRAMKQAIGKVEKAGALGVKVIIGGRLNGAEIARSEMLVSGKIPLHTLRADIDFAIEEAHTTYGVIGIQVWIYRGDVFKTALVAPEVKKENIKS
jgi:small subunit ribosomal protein S3